MAHLKLIGTVGALAATALLSGCVVAPPGYYNQGYAQPYGTPYGAAYEPAYVAPAPVVVAPPISFGLYGGYYRGGPYYRGGGPRRWR